MENYEQLFTNLVMAGDLVDKAKKQIFVSGDPYFGKATEMNKQEYNKALEYASKLILESRI